MGKVIFTSSADEYFKLKKSSSNPTLIAKIPKKANTVTVNEQANLVTTTLYALIDGDTGDSTNAELYEQLTESLTANSVTKVQTVMNEYVVLLDYTIYNQKGVKIERKTSTQEIDAKDVAVIMGVDSTNNTTYRHGKQMVATFKAKLENQSPFGVMASKRRNCTLVINEIAVFQALDIPEKKQKYVSSYDLRRMNDGCATKKHFIKDMVRIYSSAENGIEFSDIKLPYIPVTISIAVNILDINFTVVYDDAEIVNIITQNRDAASSDSDDDTTDSTTDTDTSTDDGTDDDVSTDDSDTDDDSTDDSDSDDDDGSTFDYDDTDSE